jgi:hypothetical protein
VIGLAGLVVARPLLELLQLLLELVKAACDATEGGLVRNGTSPPQGRACRSPGRTRSGGCCHQRCSTDVRRRQRAACERLRSPTSARAERIASVRAGAGDDAR